VQRDLVVGTGPVARRAHNLTVHYVGVAWSTRAEIDASWGRGRFEFTFGIGQVIEVWERGLAGMRLGGRRELIIPPELAYGEEGVGDIGPNETLVFVVDLLRVD
jgi:peptidylprolyl isomerase